MGNDVKPKIWLDSGNESKSGIVVGDLVENDVTHDIMSRVDFLLEDVAVETMLSRALGEHPTHSKRSEEANGWGADLAIHCHVDGRPADEHGMRLLHWPGNPVTRWACNEMASRFVPDELYPVDVFAAVKPTKWGKDGEPLNGWSGVRYVMHDYRAHTILVECCNANNDKDREYILSEWGRNRVAFAIKGLILSWCERKRK